MKNKAIRKFAGSDDLSLQKLVNEFGEDKEDEIRKLYYRQKAILEDGAKIKDYISIFTYKLVNQTLRAKYYEGYIEKKVYPIQKDMLT